MPDIGPIRPQLTEMIEPIRALIVLPLLYAMLTQLRTSPEPTDYTFLAALANGLIGTLAVMVAWWIVKRYGIDDREEATLRE